MAGSLTAVLFPDQCRICGRVLSELTPAPVCPACLVRSLQSPEEVHACQLCGLPLEEAAARQGVAQCGVCRRQPPAFDRARGLGTYEGDLRRLIHLLKYQKIKALARPLAAAMAERLGELGKIELIVPVPLFGLRKWRRGFNQADELARELARLAAIPWNRKVLHRVRPTRPQVGLSHRQRRLNLAGAFAVRNPDSVRGRCLLLVDDVMTTGATLQECARVLEAAGAARVAGLTAARAKRRLVEGNESFERSVSSFSAAR